MPLKIEVKESHDEGGLLGSSIRKNRMQQVYWGHQRSGSQMNERLLCRQLWSQQQLQGRCQRPPHARGTVTEVDSDRNSADQEKSVFGGLSRSGVCVVYICVHLKAVGQYLF